MRAAPESSENDDPSILDPVELSAASERRSVAKKSAVLNRLRALTELVVTSGAFFKFSFYIFVREHPAETPGNVL
jgi:hypothetical protein